MEIGEEEDDIVLTRALQDKPAGRLELTHDGRAVGRFLAELSRQLGPGVTHVCRADWLKQTGATPGSARCDAVLPVQSVKKIGLSGRISCVIRNNVLLAVGRSDHWFI